MLGIAWNTTLQDSFSHAYAQLFWDTQQTPAVSTHIWDLIQETTIENEATGDDDATPEDTNEQEKENTSDNSDNTPTQEDNTPSEKTSPEDDTTTEEETTNNEKTTPKQDTPPQPTDNEPARLPEQINLDIPFFAQAPDGDRSLPRRETCEEASLILVSAFLDETPLTKQEFKNQIQEMVDLQNQLFWQYIDTSVAQTDTLYKTIKPSWKTKIIDNPTIEDLKYELTQWHPIVAPFAWKILNNPHYANGWPRYHMLVIRWYDQQNFYTNDVGTSQWNNFPYTYNNLMNALHDFVPKDEGAITNGEKRVLVIIE